MKVFVVKRFGGGAEQLFGHIRFRTTYLPGTSSFAGIEQERLFHGLYLWNDIQISINQLVRKFLTKILLLSFCKTLRSSFTRFGNVPWQIFGQQQLCKLWGEKMLSSNCRLEDVFVFWMVRVIKKKLN